MKSPFLLTLALCTAGMMHFTNAADPAKPEPAKSLLPDPVAVVEGKEIKAADVESAIATYLQRTGKKPAEVTDAEKLQAARMLVQNLIAQQLVNTRAAKVKVTDADIEARYQQFMAQIPDQKKFEEQLKANDMTIPKLKEKLRESMMQQQWIEGQLGNKGDVTETEGKEFFDSHSTYFEQPEMVRVSHILLTVPENAKPEVVAEKQKAIDAAAARVAKGEDFATVAKEVSEDPGSKPNGGDLNFCAKTGLVPEFAAAAFALKKDEVSKPVKTKFGFHIIKLTDRKDARKVPYEEVKTKIIANLSNQKKQQAARVFLQDLIAKSDVKINLPPEEKKAPEAAPAAPKK